MANIKTFDAGAVQEGPSGPRMQSGTINSGATVLQGVAEASSTLIQASDRISNREATIDRTQKTAQYRKDVEAEWQRVSDDKGFTDPESLKQFNSFLENKKAELVTGHAGYGDSKARLETHLIGQNSHYESQAIGAMRTGQIKLLTTEYGEQMNPVLAQVSDGSISAVEAFAQVNTISDDIGGNEEQGYTLPRSVAFDMHDAAQSAVAMASVNRHLDSGDWRSAQIELDKPANNFGQVLDSTELGGLTKRIGKQRLAYNLADQQVRSQRNAKANDLGYTNWGEVPRDIKFAIATNSPIPGTERFSPLSDVGKEIADMKAIKKFYPNDKKTQQQFQQLINQKNTIVMSSPLGKMQQDLQKLKTAGKGDTDPTVKALTAQIEAKNPVLSAARDKLAKYPAAKIALDTFSRRAQGMEDDAKKAIMMWTGESTYEKALKTFADIKATKGDLIDTGFALGTSGALAKANQFMPGSDINEIDAILTRIGGKAMIDSLAALKANSPTGSSGMGALNKTEGDALRFQEGALDINAPETTVETLINLVNNTGTVIKNQTSAFNTAFGNVEITPEKDGDKSGKAKDKPAVPPETAASVVVRYGLDGKPINP